MLWTQVLSPPPPPSETELLFFYADWCGPCKQVKPVVEELVGRSPMRIRLVNVDRNGELASKHGIRSIPTFVFLAKGREVSRHTGSLSASALRAKVEGR